MSDLMQLLDMAKDADASQCRQAIGLFTARLRELEEIFDKACLEVYEGITKDTATSPSPWHQPTAHLPDRYSKCAVCGIMRDIHDRVPGTTTTHIFRSEAAELHQGHGHSLACVPSCRLQEGEGAELQAGLEEAVRRSDDV